MQKLGLPVEQEIGMLHEEVFTFDRTTPANDSPFPPVNTERAADARAEQTSAAEAVAIDGTSSKSADLLPAKQLDRNVAATNPEEPSSATSSGLGRPRPWFFSGRSADGFKEPAPMPSIKGMTPARHIPLLNRSRFVFNNQQPKVSAAASTESPAPTIRDGASAASHVPPVLHSNFTAGRGHEARARPSRHSRRVASEPCPATARPPMLVATRQTDRPRRPGAASECGRRRCAI